MCNEKIVIFADGACSGNGKENAVGGWGVVLQYFKDDVKVMEKELFDGEPNTTNNRMEIMSCIQGLKAIKKTDIPIEIYTDSAYVYNCINEKWYVKWEANGWILSSKKAAVENKELWKELLTLYRKLKPTFIKVKGHSDNEGNNRADELARNGVTNAKNVINKRG